MPKYLSAKPLWEKDTSPEGFTWLVGNDAHSNILVFARWDEAGNRSYASLTSHPVPHERYSLSLPIEGSWNEISILMTWLWR
ncbi:MAG: alpha amylase C-terminal domain-containing protein [Actinomycetota bacterium]